MNALNPVLVKTRGLLEVLLSDGGLRDDDDEANSNPLIAVATLLGRLDAPLFEYRRRVILQPIAVSRRFTADLHLAGHGALVSRDPRF